MKPNWIIKDIKFKPLRSSKVKKPTPEPMSLLDSQQMMREYVAKNPATIVKVVARDLGWTISKAAFVKSTMKSEFYDRGLILKLSVNTVNALLEPIHTSPQALTPITADDVSDECVQELWLIGRLTHLGHIGKNDVAACINAWLKHKGETK